MSFMCVLRDAQAREGFGFEAVFYTLDWRLEVNDLTIGRQNFNLLSHPNATLAPQARHARPSEILNYSLSH